MSTPSATCSQCGASAAGARIFCDKCGAALQTPVPLVLSDFPDTPVRMSTLKRATIVLIKGIGAIAVLVFGFSPMTTNTGIFLFGASIVVGFFCFIALTYLDDDFPKVSGEEGYWPKSLDWNRSLNNSTNEKPTDSHID